MVLTQPVKFCCTGAGEKRPDGRRMLVVDISSYLTDALVVV